MFPIEKYRFIVLPEKRKVIAISTYAGKPVRGVAKCAAGDEFDVDFGKKLAAAKCDFKIQMKRLEAINRKIYECNTQISHWETLLDKYATHRLKDTARISESIQTIYDLIGEKYA